MFADGSRVSDDTSAWAASWLRGGDNSVERLRVTSVSMFPPPPQNQSSSLPATPSASSVSSPTKTRTSRWGETPVRSAASISKGDNGGAATQGATSPPLERKEADDFLYQSQQRGDKHSERSASLLNTYYATGRNLDGSAVDNQQVFQKQVEEGNRRLAAMERSRRGHAATPRRGDHSSVSTLAQTPSERRYFGPTASSSLKQKSNTSSSNMPKRQQHQPAAEHSRQRRVPSAVRTKVQQATTQALVAAERREYQEQQLKKFNQHMNGASHWDTQLSPALHLAQHPPSRSGSYATTSRSPSRRHSSLSPRRRTEARSVVSNDPRNMSPPRKGNGLDSTVENARGDANDIVGQDPAAPYIMDRDGNKIALFDASKMATDMSTREAEGYYEDLVEDGRRDPEEAGKKKKEWPPWVPEKPWENLAGNQMTQTEPTHIVRLKSGVQTPDVKKAKVPHVLRNEEEEEKRPAHDNSEREEEKNRLAKAKHHKQLEQQTPNVSAIASLGASIADGDETEGKRQKPTNNRTDATTEKNKKKNSGEEAFSPPSAANYHSRRGSWRQTPSKPAAEQQQQLPSPLRRMLDASSSTAENENVSSTHQREGENSTITAGETSYHPEVAEQVAREQSPEVEQQHRQHERWEKEQEERLRRQHEEEQRKNEARVREVEERERLLMERIGRLEREAERRQQNTNDKADRGGVSDALVQPVTRNDQQRSGDAGHNESSSVAVSQLQGVAKQLTELQQQQETMMRQLLLQKEQPPRGGEETGRSASTLPPLLQQHYTSQQPASPQTQSPREPTNADGDVVHYDDVNVSSLQREASPPHVYRYGGRGRGSSVDAANHTDEEQQHHSHADDANGNTTTSIIGATPGAASSRYDELIQQHQLQHRKDERGRPGREDQEHVRRPPVSQQQHQQHSVPPKREEEEPIAHRRMFPHDWIRLQHESTPSGHDAASTFYRLKESYQSIRHRNGVAYASKLYAASSERSLPAATSSVAAPSPPSAFVHDTAVAPTPSAAAPTTMVPIQHQQLSRSHLNTQTSAEWLSSAMPQFGATSHAQSQDASSSYHHQGHPATMPPPPSVPLAAADTLSLRTASPHNSIASSSANAVVNGGAPLSAFTVGAAQEPPAVIPRRGAPPPPPPVESNTHIATTFYADDNEPLSI